MSVLYGQDYEERFIREVLFKMLVGKAFIKVFVQLSLSLDFVRFNSIILVGELTKQFTGGVKIIIIIIII